MAGTQWALIDHAENTRTTQTELLCESAKCIRTKAVMESERKQLMNMISNWSQSIAKLEQQKAKDDQHALESERTVKELALELDKTKMELRNEVEHSERMKCKFDKTFVENQKLTQELSQITVQCQLDRDQKVQDRGEIDKLKCYQQKVERMQNEFKMEEQRLNAERQQIREQRDKLKADRIQQIQMQSHIEMETEKLKTKEAALDKEMEQNKLFWMNQQNEQIQVNQSKHEGEISEMKEDLDKIRKERDDLLVQREALNIKVAESDSVHLELERLKNDLTVYKTQNDTESDDSPFDWLKKESERLKQLKQELKRKEKLNAEQHEYLVQEFVRLEMAAMDKNELTTLSSEVTEVSEVVLTSNGDHEDRHDLDNQKLDELQQELLDAQYEELQANFAKLEFDRSEFQRQKEYAEVQLKESADRMERDRIELEMETQKCNEMRKQMDEKKAKMRLKLVQLTSKCHELEVKCNKLENELLEAERKLALSENLVSDRKALQQEREQLDQEMKRLKLKQFDFAQKQVGLETFEHETKKMRAILQVDRDQLNANVAQMKTERGQFEHEINLQREAMKEKEVDLERQKEDIAQKQNEIKRSSRNLNIQRKQIVNQLDELKSVQMRIQDGWKHVGRGKQQAQETSDRVNQRRKSLEEVMARLQSESHNPSNDKLLTGTQGTSHMIDMKPNNSLIQDNGSVIERRKSLEAILRKLQNDRLRNDVTGTWDTAPFIQAS